MNGGVSTGSLETTPLTIQIGMQVHCRTGSLETVVRGMAQNILIHCRTGSLETVVRGMAQNILIHCRTGSLETQVTRRNQNALPDHRRDCNERRSGICQEIRECPGYRRTYVAGCTLLMPGQGKERTHKHRAFVWVG